GILRLEIYDDADRILSDRAIRLYCGAVRAKQIVSGERRFEDAAMSRRERPMQVAAIGDDPRLVERRPDRLAIVERAEAHLRVFDEPVRHVAVDPSASIVERGRKVPMKERDERLNVVRAQFVDETAIEIEAFVI